jgi:hypothetical protein
MAHELDRRMILSTKQHRIVRAALTELNAKLNRGLANSGLEHETVRLLRETPDFHESDVLSLLEKIDPLLPWSRESKRQWGQP